MSLWLIVLCVSVPLRLFAAGPVNVTFTARDGVTVSGALYLPSRRPASAVILLHMLTRSHEDWDQAANRLADAGIAALAIDFRRSVAAPETAPSGEERSDYTAYVLDAQAARQFLGSRSEIMPTSIGIAGASIGANAAVLVAAADPSIRSLALLSPGLEYRNLRIEAAMRKYGDRPALLVASEEDPYAWRSVRQLITLGNGRREQRVLNGAGHGTVMLNRQADLIQALVDWFNRTLL